MRGWLEFNDIKKYPPIILPQNNIGSDTSIQSTFKKSGDIIPLEHTVMCFPNPANNFIQVFTQAGNNFQELCLFSIDGKLLRKVELLSASSSIPLDITNIQTGIYVVKSKINDQIFRQMITVAK